ncbi:MAG: ATP-binding cassette domain-containing protein [Leptonema illini]|uniref:ATP-binding cassette domain-containing protein n=1 Tax=Leptonema illini TaxID=183 RepID=A0A833H4U0_9LEPT|nr:MAG: ATP-binding cassette domain-containing protein [Leptonema illini]
MNKTNTAGVDVQVDAHLAIEGRFALTLNAFELNVEFLLPGKGVTVICGSSGAGKSTFLRCLAGLERPHSSYLKVRGEVWQDSSSRIFLPAHKRSIGMVFQAPSLFTHLSVRQNLLFGRKKAKPRSDLEKSEYLFDSLMAGLGLDRLFSSMENEEGEEFQGIVHMLGIGGLLNRHVGQLSGGEMQRVGIARALLRQPQVLLMDEPLASLDQRRKDEILPYLERLHAELTLPVVYVTHSREEALRLADRVIEMEGGRIVRSGTPGQILYQATSQGDDVRSEFNAVVEDLESDGLSRLKIGSSDLYILSQGSVPGDSVRCRIPASDISIALSRSADSSVLNQLPCTVIAIERSSIPAHLLVKLLLDDCETVLFARITERSCRQLGVLPGKSVWAQIKAVAIQA